MAARVPLVPMRFRTFVVLGFSVAPVPATGIFLI
jgi:hypothetical protein